MAGGAAIVTEAGGVIIDISGESLTEPLLIRIAESPGEIREPD